MGLVSDFAKVIQFFFVFGTILFVCVLASSDVISVEQNAGFLPAGSLQYVLTMSLFSEFNIFNDLGPLLFFGLMTLALFLAAYNNPSPMNIAIGFIIILFSPFIAGLFSNIVHAVWTNALLAPTAMSFNQIILIAAQFPLYVIGFSFLYILVIAIRSRYFRGNDQSQQQGEMNYGI